MSRNRWNRAALALLGATALCFPESRQALAEDAAQIRKSLVDRIEASPKSIFRVLREYNKIESRAQFDIFERHGIHTALLAALREVEGRMIARVAKAVLKRPAATEVPMKVLMMKVLIGDKFPGKRKHRVKQLVRLTRNEQPRIQIWSVRLLADSRWEESIDALVEILRTEEIEHDAKSLLWNVASGELYRLLGTAAWQGTTADVIEAHWEKSDKKIPENADHELLGSKGKTIAFFGDMISPQSVFVIDSSGSMGQTATVTRGRPRGKNTVGKDERNGPKKPKIEIVKKELERSLSRLQAHFDFNVVSYDRGIHPWRPGESLRLEKASASNLESAITYAQQLKPGSGTNIHAALAAALAVPDVETVYLLSDGAPSVGGGADAIEKRLAAMNYLRGVRVITYGFAAEEEGSFDEDLMKRLARSAWGWYRRLN